MNTARTACATGICILCLTFLLPACSLLTPQAQPALRTYALDSASEAIQPLAEAKLAVETASPGAEKRVILITTPTAASGYDSARMVYTREAGTLEAFTHSAWVDTPARMLVPVVARALRATRAFRAVLQAPSSARADLRLDLSIERLQQSYLQTPSQARLTLRATLLDNRNQEVLAWKEFDMQQAATTEDAAGAAAASRALVQLAAEALASWITTH
jgi:cholesterol transport system auxiliary component